MNNFFMKIWNKSFRSGGGFTLIELMIVIAIMMILAGAIVARIGSGSDKAKEAKAMAELEQIASACRSFYADTGLWPRTFNDLIATQASPPTLGYDEQRASRAITAGSFKGPYLETKTIPNDPWGYPYAFYTTSTPREFYIRCGTGHTNTRVLVHVFAT